MDIIKIYIYFSNNHGPNMEIRYDENEVSDEFLPIDLALPKVNEKFTVYLCCIDYHLDNFIKIMDTRSYNHYDDAYRFLNSLDNDYITMNYHDDENEGEIFSVIIDNVDKNIVYYRAIYV